MIIDTALYAAYVVLLIVVCVTPGPAVLFVLSQAAWRGPRAGVAAAAGIEIGNAVYYALTAMGLTAVIAASSTAFLVLKWAGAAYLAWLGFSAIAASFKAKDAPAETAPRSRSAFAFRDALIVQLANPKALLFFIALLPQFIDPRAPTTPQIVVLAATSMAIELVVLTGYAFAAGSLRKAMRAPTVARWFDRSVGGALLALAGATALLKRAA